MNKDNSSVQGLKEILSGRVQTISILFYSPFTTGKNMGHTLKIKQIGPVLSM